MTAALMATIDISAFWPEAKTVNAVYVEYGPKFGLNAYTLKKAKEGDLESAKMDNLLALRRLCSEWAGREVSLDEIVRS
ncbi:hypothetical protein [Pseudanabaena sp. FACHB-2040]|uniref:hypothetical protein n=1 Tax=Pseudanabaena sp. FACHB-2040 TaxID=2692859 RepID=UPI001681ED2A|nr:hypothetical protein [Pseudanabaena sp. FACHB-2040]MBD2261385.1 hypothetical protein [Pseudanabaena sp. FACHB-2040]